jgi:hypothetical protein
LKNERVYRPKTGRRYAQTNYRQIFLVPVNDLSSLPAANPNMLGGVRPRQQVGWNHQAKSLGGLEIDQKLRLGRLLDREIRRLSAFQNLVDINSGASMLISIGIRLSPPAST